MLTSMLMRRIRGCEQLISQGRLALITAGTGPSDNNVFNSVAAAPCRYLSLSSPVAMPFEKRMGPSAWPRLNKKVYPPQGLEDKRRPSVCFLFPF